MEANKYNKDDILISELFRDKKLKVLSFTHNGSSWIYSFYNSGIKMHEEYLSKIEKTEIETDD